MIRIDEIYNNVFLLKILTKTRQSMHCFYPFGRTDYPSLHVHPLINDRDNTFLMWDQEPYFPEIHNTTIQSFVHDFIYPSTSIPPSRRVGVPVSKCTFVTSEKNSKNVDDMCERNEFTQSYYFFHGWASLDWFRGYNRTFLIKDYKERSITNTFILPNRIVSGKRKHRIALFDKLVQDNSIKDNIVSFPKNCPYNNQEINIDNIKLPLTFKNENANNIPNESYKISLWNQAKNSLVYVVTETVYKEKTLHLTEKTFKPIVMQLPFILVAPKYSLEYLRSYGFKTFNEFWNEDYDLQDNNERMDSIAKLIKDLNVLSLKEKAQLQKHISPIVEHNFNWFYSDKFENLLWNELTTMMKQW